MITMFIVFPGEDANIQSSPADCARPTVARSAILPPMIEGGFKKGCYLETSVSSAVLADE